MVVFRVFQVFCPGLARAALSPLRALALVVDARLDVDLAADFFRRLGGRALLGGATLGGLLGRGHGGLWIGVSAGAQGEARPGRDRNKVCGGCHRRQGASQTSL